MFAADTGLEVDILQILRLLCSHEDVLVQWAVQLRAVTAVQSKFSAHCHCQCECDVRLRVVA